MLAQMSGPLLGIRVSAKEVSNALHTIVPAAKAFLSRPLGDRKWMYLYVDGTNFRVRRTTVDVEPTLVVLGVDETGRKSVFSMVQGDKDSRTAWDAVFVDLKERGLDGSCVLAGIMDGLPGLGDPPRVRLGADAHHVEQAARSQVARAPRASTRRPHQVPAQPRTVYGKVLPDTRNFTRPALLVDAERNRKHQRVVRKSRGKDDVVVDRAVLRHAN